MHHRFNVEREYNKLQFKFHSITYIKKTIFFLLLGIAVLSVAYFTYANFITSGKYDVTNTTVGTFAQKTYTITLDANGGSVTPSTIAVANNSAYGTLPTPTKIGNSFNGWFTAASGGTQVTSDTIYEKSQGDLTIYAQWTANNYTITYDGNGGTPSYSTQNITYGATYDSLPTVSKSYYDFVGWYTELVGGTKITTTSTYSVEGNQTLYAHYNGTHFYMDYNPDYNDNGANYSAGANVKSFDITIKDENDNVVYTDTGISDYYSNQAPYNGTYYFTNVTYRDNYGYAGYTLRNDYSRGDSNLTMNSVGANGSSFTFKHSTPGTIWFSINTKQTKKMIISGGTSYYGDPTVTATDASDAAGTNIQSNGWHTAGTGRVQADLPNLVTFNSFTKLCFEVIYLDTTALLGFDTTSSNEWVHAQNHYVTISSTGTYCVNIDSNASGYIAEQVLNVGVGLTAKTVVSNNIWLE